MKRRREAKEGGREESRAERKKKDENKGEESGKETAVSFWEKKQKTAVTSEGRRASGRLKVCSMDSAPKRAGSWHPTAPLPSCSLPGSEDRSGVAQQTVRTRVLDSSHVLSLVPP